MRKLTGYVGIALLLVSGGWMAARAQQASLRLAQVVVLADGAERLSFAGNQALSPKKTFVLQNPDRIVIDLPATQAAAMALPPTYRGVLMKAVRFGQFDPTTSRIVLDLHAPAAVKQVIPGNPLVLELTAQAAAAPISQKASAKNPAISAGEGAAQPLSPPEDMKPLIVIDAGHGGQDPGALGAGGVHEKEVTLAFARALRKALLHTGRYRVTLTREDDHFLMLKDRVEVARKAGADVLISLHADSNPKAEARGLSFYTLSATASDDEAAALAERENKSDILQGIDLNTTDADVANILIDLTQRETMNKSTQLADMMVENLHPKISRLPRTHRFAGFRVLKSPDVPSVLIELGFLSNEADERLLQSPEYRDLVVDSIIKGLGRYFAAR